ncbi:MAG: hypothetical protein ABIL62_19630, partial [Planctomycetota bacterium]
SHDRNLPPTLFRGREIAFSVTKKLRLWYRVDQTPRQITTIWHVVLSVPQFADFDPAQDRYLNSKQARITKI